MADNTKANQLVRWVDTGDLLGESGRPPEDTPEVHIAKEQIRKDGKVIPEHVARAVEAWREHHKTSKPAELS